MNQVKIKRCTTAIKPQTNTQFWFVITIKILQMLGYLRRSLFFCLGYGWLRQEADPLLLEDTFIKKGGKKAQLLNFEVRFFKNLSKLSNIGYHCNIDIFINQNYGSFERRNPRCKKLDNEVTVHRESRNKFWIPL